MEKRTIRNADFDNNEEQLSTSDEIDEGVFGSQNKSSTQSREIDTTITAIRTTIMTRPKPI
jgi:hypothetical protein